jgi:large subunit ribosomal protein L13
MAAAAVRSRPASAKTFHATPSTVEESRAWFIADVEGKTLGRAATKIASVLRGKHRATFTRHEDAGDFVVVINADKVKLTGKKWSDKTYYDHSLFPGGMKTLSAAQLLARHPEELVKRAVWGMIPKGPLGRRIYKKLKVYSGDKHPHAAQQPKPLAL